MPDNKTIEFRSGRGNIVKFKVNVRLLLEAENEADALHKSDPEFDRFLTRVISVDDTLAGKSDKNGEAWMKLVQSMREKFTLWIKWVITNFKRERNGFQMVEDIAYEGFEEWIDDSYHSTLRSISGLAFDDRFERLEHLFEFTLDLKDRDFTVFVNAIYETGPQPDGALIYHLNEVSIARNEVRVVKVYDTSYEPDKESKIPILTRLFLRADEKGDALSRAGTEATRFFNEMMTSYVILIPHNQRNSRPKDVLEAEMIAQRERFQERFIQWVTWAVANFKRVEGGFQMITERFLPSNDDNARLVRTFDQRAKKFLALFAENPSTTWNQIYQLPEEDYGVFVYHFIGASPPDALVFFMKEITEEHKVRRKVEVEIEEEIEEVHFEPVVEKK